MKSTSLSVKTFNHYRFIFLFQQDPKRTQNDFNPRLFWFIEFFLPIIFVALSSILIVHNNMAFTPGHGFFLPIYYVACIAGLSFEHPITWNFFSKTFLFRLFSVSKAYVSRKFFMGTNKLYKVILPAVCCCIFILIKIKLELLTDYELGYPDSIYFWICCLSIGKGVF